MQVRDAEGVSPKIGRLEHEKVCTLSCAAVLLMLVASTVHTAVVARELECATLVERRSPDVDTDQNASRIPATVLEVSVPTKGLSLAR